MLKYHVEGVASAIHRANPNAAYGWFEAAPSHRENAMKMARAAIEEMERFGALKKNGNYILYSLGIFG